MQVSSVLAKTPLVDQGGLITAPWAKAFNADPTTSGQTAQIAALQATVSALSATVAGLSATVAAQAAQITLLQGELNRLFVTDSRAYITA